MKFSANQQDIQKSLNYCQGVIEKRSTLPILSNVLLEASKDELILTATDLDMVFIHKISNVDIKEEGKTLHLPQSCMTSLEKFPQARRLIFQF